MLGLMIAPAERMAVIGLTIGDLAALALIPMLSLNWEMMDGVA
jgi:hypothetical protein